MDFYRPGEDTVTQVRVADAQWKTRTRDIDRLLQVDLRDPRSPNLARTIPIVHPFVIVSSMPPATGSPSALTVRIENVAAQVSWNVIAVTAQCDPLRIRKHAFLHTPQATARNVVSTGPVNLGIGALKTILDARENLRLNFWQHRVGHLHERRCRDQK